MVAFTRNICLSRKILKKLHKGGRTTNPIKFKKETENEREELKLK